MPAKKQTIRLGIVGGGGIVKQRHIPGFSKCKNVEIVAVCNRTEESSQAFAKAYGVERCYVDWHELVNADDIDAVVIGTWPYMHRDVAVESLAAGKHVFCQARMARTAAEAREMEEAWKRSGLTAMLCPPPIAMHAGNLIRQILYTGKIGKILSVHVRHMDGAYLDSRAPLSWRLNRDYQGVNTLTLGMYAEVLHGFFSETLSVQATTRIVTHRRLNPETGKRERVEIAEEVFVNAVMRGGIHTHYTLSGLAAHGGDCTIEFFGTEGTLKYILQDEQVWFGKSGKPLRQRKISERNFRPWTVEEDFIDAIRDGVTDPNPNFSDGVRYMDVTEAVYRSAQSGSTIRLPLCP